eukprot:TRINITY_DN31274_c0_g1_i1.p1 TRINITY_DN31274_c0_g1~~TRINITY_DN31274_c0_g1_i1.p1  ORF type:complete len:352 (+),score=62.23 TRINITY_DN31274_c0_g1_i1:59-1114(+)
MASLGDIVQVRDTLTTRSLGVAEGWWSQGMLTYCGLYGEVRDTFQDKVMVRFNDHSTWWYNRSCLLREHESADSLDTTSSGRRGSGSSFDEEYIEWVVSGSIEKNHLNNKRESSPSTNSEEYLPWTADCSVRPPAFHQSNHSLLSRGSTSSIDSEEYLAWVASNQLSEDHQQETSAASSRRGSGFSSSTSEYIEWIEDNVKMDQSDQQVTSSGHQSHFEPNNRRGSGSSSTDSEEYSTWITNNDQENDSPIDDQHQRSSNDTISRAELIPAPNNESVGRLWLESNNQNNKLHKSEVDGNEYCMSPRNRPLSSLGSPATPVTPTREFPALPSSVVVSPPQQPVRMLTCLFSG